MKPIALVINSDLDQIKRISKILGNHGLEVISASNGIEGLQCLYSKSPDITFCSYDLPLVSGVDIIKIAKSLKRLEQMPFVFTANQPNQEVIMDANRLKADGFIDEPVAACDLIYTIKKHINETSTYC